MAPSDLNIHVSIHSFPVFISSFLSPQSAVSPRSAPRPSSSTQSMWLILGGRYSTNSCHINWMGESGATTTERCSNVISPCLMFPYANIAMFFKGWGATYTWKMSWNRSPRESMPLAAEIEVGGLALHLPWGQPESTEWIWRHLATNGQPHHWPSIIGLLFQLCVFLRNFALLQLGWDNNV